MTCTCPADSRPRSAATFRNPQLADTYRELARTDLASFYGGAVGRDLVRTVQQPPVVPGSTRNVRAGAMELSDLARYQVERRDPTVSRYRGLDVYGMAPPSSGGTTVGEALNILESTDLSKDKATDVEYLHRFIESTKLAFADRLRWVGDPAFSRVPTDGLLSQKFADSRACLIKPDAVLPAPQPAADPRNPKPCATAAVPSALREDAERTTHLTVADRWGNVVAYTLTIEAEGGSGIVVPGRGFLLNNELTDFEFVAPTAGVPHPNLPGPGKRPRSSMSPTIVLDHGKVVLAVGSPGGSTIITTVTQILTSRLDRKMPLLDAVAAPRASQRNAAATPAEAAFIASAAAEGLRRHRPPVQPERRDRRGHGHRTRFGRPLARRRRADAARWWRGASGEGGLSARRAPLSDPLSTLENWGYPASAVCVVGGYQPVWPSMRSRMRSAWPLCWAYSSIMWM